MDHQSYIFKNYQYIISIHHLQLAKNIVYFRGRKKKLGIVLSDGQNPQTGTHHPRGTYVYVEESFETIFSMSYGYGSVKWLIIRGIICSRLMCFQFFIHLVSQSRL